MCVRTRGTVCGSLGAPLSLVMSPKHLITGPEQDPSKRRLLSCPQRRQPTRADDPMRRDWTSRDVERFAGSVFIEDWLLARFWDDLLVVQGSAPSYMRRFSPKTRRILRHETAELISYLLPWAFVIAYKILEIVHQCSRNAVPRVFVKYPFLQVCCESLRDSMRRPRNKIVHVGNYGLYFLPYKFKNRTFKQYFFVVRDEHGKQLLKLDFWDILSVIVVTRSVAAALKKNAVSGTYVYLMIDQFKYLSGVGLIPFGEMLTLREVSPGRLRSQWKRGSLLTSAPDMSQPWTRLGR